MRWFRLLAALLRNSVQAQMEYRPDLWASAANSVLIAALAWATLPTLFARVENLGGWTLDPMIALFGVAMILEGLMSCWLLPSLNAVSDYVRRGDLDLLLIRPVDSQFFVSLRHVRPWNGMNVVIGGGAVLYAMHAEAALSLGNAALFLVLLLSAVAILYTIFLVATTLAFWFTQVEEVWIIPFTLMQTGRFPVAAYPVWSRFLLTFVVPIVFMTNLPAEAAIGRLTWPWALAGLAAGAFALLLARAFWRLGLARYSSASS